MTQEEQRKLNLGISKKALLLFTSLAQEFTENNEFIDDKVYLFSIEFDHNGLDFWIWNSVTGEHEYKALSLPIWHAKDPEILNTLDTCIELFHKYKFFNDEHAKSNSSTTGA